MIPSILFLALAAATEIDSETLPYGIHAGRVIGPIDAGGNFQVLMKFKPKRSSPDAEPEFKAVTFHAVPNPVVLALDRSRGRAEDVTTGVRVRIVMAPAAIASHNAGNSPKVKLFYRRMVWRIMIEGK